MEYFSGYSRNLKITSDFLAKGEKLEKKQFIYKNIMRIYEGDIS